MHTLYCECGNTPSMTSLVPCMAVRGKIDTVRPFIAWKRTSYCCALGTASQVNVSLNMPGASYNQAVYLKLDGATKGGDLALAIGLGGEYVQFFPVESTNSA